MGGSQAFGFKNSYLTRDRRFLCGLVNARNGYGGYTGYKRSIYRIDNDALAISNDKDDKNQTNRMRTFNDDWMEFVCDKTLMQQRRRAILEFEILQAAPTLTSLVDNSS